MFQLVSACIILSQMYVFLSILLYPNYMPSFLSSFLVDATSTLRRNIAKHFCSTDSTEFILNILRSYGSKSYSLQHKHSFHVKAHRSLLYRQSPVSHISVSNSLIFHHLPLPRPHLDCLRRTSLCTQTRK